MKNLFKNNTALIGIWVDSLIGLAIVIAAYAIFMPIEWFIANTVMSMGAPAGTTLFLMKMLRWGLIGMGVTCLIIPFAYTWLRTPDQGVRDDTSGWYK